MRFFNLRIYPSHCQFDDKINAQKEGVPKGSSISCIVVKILMDDVFAVNKIKTDLDFRISTERHLNSIERGIEFTFEIEIKCLVLLEMTQVILT